MKIRLFTIPNIITLGNLMCGAGAIVATLVYDSIPTAFILVMTAAVLDFFDGFTARLLKQYSDIGIQLDSLADMVSFGTVPSVVFYKLASESTAVYLSGTAAAVLPFIPFLMTAFSALRLAKFNIDDTQHEEFSGLTTTANGIFCTSFAAALVWSSTPVAAEWIAVISILTACLLISPIRMFSFKFRTFDFRSNALRYCFAAVAIVILLICRTYAIPAIIILYTVVSTIRWMFTKSR